jgi:hypothetical protein
MKQIFLKQATLILFLYVFCSIGFSQKEKSKTECKALYPFIERKQNGEKGREKEGYIDCNGKVVVPPQFTSASVFNEGMGIVFVKEPSGISYGKLINLKGEIVTNESTKVAPEFSQGLAPALTPEGYGYVNGKGELALLVKHKLDKNYEGDPISHFSEGLALIVTDEGSGFIDKSGEIVIKPQFGNMGDVFKNGMARVWVDGKWGVINKQGEYIIKPQEKHISPPSDGIAVLQQGDDEWIGLNDKGQIQLRVFHDELGDFHEGLAQFKSKTNGKWGFIDKSGRIVVAPKYDSVGDFSEGLAVVITGNRINFINTKDEVQTPLKVTDVYEGFKNGLAYVRIGNYDAYINKKGKIIWKLYNPE